MNIPHDQQARSRQLENLFKRMTHGHSSSYQLVDDDDNVVGYSNSPETVEDIFNQVPPEKDNK